MRVVVGGFRRSSYVIDRSSNSGLTDNEAIYHVERRPIRLGVVRLDI